MIDYLCSDRKPDVVRELTADLSRRSFGMRMALCSGMSGAWHGFGRSGIAPATPELRMLIEATLVGLLADEAEDTHETGTIHRYSAICDVAAGILSRLLSAEYKFDVDGDFASRRRERLEIQRLWNLKYGLPPPASPTHLVPSGTRAGEGVNVTFHDAGLENTPTGKALAGLRGQQADPGRLMELLVAFALDPPEGINGMDIRLVRTGGTEGIGLCVWSHPGGAPQPGQRFLWHGSVERDRKPLVKEPVGNRRYHDLGQEWFWRGFSGDLAKALAYPQDSEVIARFGFRPAE